MMSPDNLIAKPPTSKDENHQSSAGSRKTGRPADVQALRCPRCDSPNTKFCYYNNYSLTQPRHFCKSCRRYWTKGGALRNIPIGGGCRKNKKISKSSSRLSGNSKDSADSSSYSDIGGGFKFFSGLSPAVDFQLGGLNNFPRIFQSSNNYTTGASSSSYNPHHQLNISSFGDLSTSSSCFGIDPSGNSTGNMMGFNYTVPSSVLKQNHGSLLEDENVLHNNSNNLTSSIESLSSINQDLHWKLQQQRLAMLFGEDNHHKEAVISPVINSHHLENQTPQKPQPILFQNLEFSSKTDDSHHGVGNLRKDNNGNGIGNLATEWFFDNSNVYNPTPTNSNSTSNGLQGWSNYNQFTALP